MGLVVAAGLRLDGRPEQVDPDRVEARRRHRREGPVEGVRADPPGPVRSLDRDVVGAHRQDRPSVPLEEVPAATDGAPPVSLRP